MPIFLLIRHGDHPLLPRRLAGRMPGVHLSPNGLTQANSLADLLSEAPLKAVYSSPMERALETAAVLAERKGLPVQVCPGIMEIDYGKLVGRTFKQLGRTKLWKVVQASPADVRFPGGETLAEAQARAVAALEDLVAAHAPEDMLALFTHGDLIRLLVAHYLQIPINLANRLGVSTASITVLHRDKEGRTYVPHLNQIQGFAIKPPTPPEKKPSRKKPAS
jgi:broad specificity phosphatase PhoE